MPSEKPKSLDFAPGHKPASKNASLDKTAQKDKLSPKQMDEAVIDLLRPHKTIRDAIHGDISLTRLEVDILDTLDFQRLHKIKQLGPTYLVYPCATHTRFEHSLGTLYMTQYLIDCVLKNPFKDERVSICVNLPNFSIHYPDSANLQNALINNYHVLLARICALLHDLAHVPFGHTLEDEGNLFKGQWDDDERVIRYLSEKSTIGSTIIRTLDAKGLNGKIFLSEVTNLIKAKKEEDIEKLPYPFVSDIFNNTICADILDYIKRDIYFCGLSEAYDERFLNYFYIGLHNGQPRLLLRLIKPSTGVYRRSVLSETLHLLRLRYSIAEKVYFNHAKISASSMLISSVNSAIKNKIIRKVDLFEIGDDELISCLKKDQIGSHIIGKFLERNLYKVIYKLKYVKEDPDNPRYSERESLIKALRDKDTRYEYERALEKMNGLIPGQVIVYCPEKEMGSKVAKTFVDIGRGKIVWLQKVNYGDTLHEIESYINDKHRTLWYMCVFVDPSLTKETRLNITSDCASLFQFRNEIEDRDYSADMPSYLERFRVRAEMEDHIILSTKDHNAIAGAVGRSLPSERPGALTIMSYEEYIKNASTYPNLWR